SATNGSNQSGPLNASEQRNKTGAGGVGKGLTVGGNVSKSVQGNTTPAGSGGGGGGLFGFSMTEDVINPTWNSTQTLLADGTTWVLNESLETTVGTPVPEDDDDDGIVFVPTNDPWKGLYHDYYVPYIFPLATVLALLGMIIECGIMPWRALRNPTFSQT